MRMTFIAGTLMLHVKTQTRGERSSVIVFPVQSEFMSLSKWLKLHDILMGMDTKIGSDLWNER